MLNASRLTLALVALCFGGMLLTTAVDAGTKAPKTPKVKLSVKKLDLSKPPTTETLMAAGQLGGQLYPTHDVKDKTKKDKVNLSFGKAIQEWNKHEYKKAAKMFEAHIAEFPDSPWEAEAVLHIGCDAQYTGRYQEAEESFSSIIDKHGKDTTHGGAKRLTDKARQRLAILKYFQNNFEESAALFTELKATSDDWHERTYASHWIQRISRAKKDKTAMLNCGTQALAQLLDQQGRADAAREVRQLIPESESGYSADELKSIAAVYGVIVEGLQVAAADLPSLPLPLIVQLNPQSHGDGGHYWILDKASDAGLEFYDPQAGRRFAQTVEQFAREWDGIALVFKQPGEELLVGQVLLDGQLAGFAGGCCGVPAAPSDLGSPPDNNGFDHDSSDFEFDYEVDYESYAPGQSGSNHESKETTAPDDPFRPEKAPKSNDDYTPGCGGAPTWAVNMVNLNLYMTDTPIWYAPAIGPALKIKISYNSQASITYSEPFGNKWQFNFGSYLVVDTGGQVTIFMPDGRNDVYSPDGSGGYDAPSGLFNTLTKLAENHFTLTLPDDTVYEYDIPAGTSSLQPFLVKVTDRHGQSLDIGYDTNVHLTSITDALGQVITLAYNANGQVDTVTDPFGRTALFGYDLSDNLVSITDMAGYTSVLSYDADANLTSLGNSRGTWQFLIEPADGDSTDWEKYPAPGAYMWENSRITVTNPEGGIEEYYYDGYYQDGYYTSPRYYVPFVDLYDNNYYSNSNKTKYDYKIVSNVGRISEIDYPSGNRDFFTYDDMSSFTVETKDGPKVFSGQGTGRLRSHTRDGLTTHYAYTNRGMVASVIDPRDLEWSYSYAANGFDLTGITNDLGPFSLGYDDERNLKVLTDRRGHKTSFTYNEYGQMLSSTDALGVVTDYLYYDAASPSKHLLKEVLRDGFVVRSLTYDAQGRVATNVDANGLALDYTYDNLDRVTTVAYPDGKQSTISYSSCCPKIVESVTSRSGRSTEYTYDALRRLVLTKREDGTLVRYQYDVDGNMIALIDPSQNKTQFSYDASGRLLEKRYADNSTETYAYQDGLLSSFTNARDITTSYSYDAVNALTGISYSDGTPGVSLTYDDHNQVVTRTDAAGTWQFGYDPSSNITSIDGPWLNDTLTMTYDDLNRLTGVTPQGGEARTYLYDDFARLGQVQFGPRRYAYNYPVNSPATLASGLVRDNGTITRYSYDTLGRLLSMTTEDSAQQLLQSHSYSYGNNDLRDSEDINDGLSLTVLGGEKVDYEYNSLNQLLSTTPATTFNYDADGNLTNGLTPEGFPFTASYDAANRLKRLQYTDAGAVGHTIDYLYDGSDMLVSKSVDGVETRYLWAGFNLLQERDAGNVVQRVYAWNPLEEGGIGGLLEFNQTGQSYSYILDGVGNVRGLIDTSEQPVATYRYDPFGVVLAENVTVNQPFRSSTKLYDPQTGLAYFGYRHYMPTLGRWLNRDPIAEKGGLNLYGYVNNSPLSLIDPKGLAFSVAGGSCMGFANLGNNLTVTPIHTSNDKIALSVSNNLTGEKMTHAPVSLNDYQKTADSIINKLVTSKGKPEPSAILKMFGVMRKMIQQPAPTNYTPAFQIKTKNGGFGVRG